MAYTGSIDLISGIRQKNGGNFPLVDAKAVQYGDNPNIRLSNVIGDMSTLKGNVSTIVDALNDSYELSQFHITEPTEGHVVFAANRYVINEPAEGHVSFSIKTTA